MEGTILLHVDVRPTASATSARQFARRSSFDSSAGDYYSLPPSILADDAEGMDEHRCVAYGEVSSSDEEIFRRYVCAVAEGEMGGGVGEAAYGVVGGDTL